MTPKTKLVLAVTTTTALAAAGIATMHRYELKKQLEKLERDRATAEAIRKSCYEISSPPKRFEFVCPTCGERTLYPVQVNMELAKARALLDLCTQLLAERLVGVKLSLDQSTLCRKCHPEGFGAVPAQTLTIRYPDDRSESVGGLTGRDLELLSHVLAGRTLPEAPEVRQSPLGQLRRLGELAPAPKP